MLKTLFSILFLLPAVVIYSQHNETPKLNYELITEYDGIVVEKFDSTITDSNKYNYNNTIYKVGNVFTYSFEHITAASEKQFFTVKGKKRKKWDFISDQESEAGTVKSFSIEVVDGNPMAENYSDYNQTNVRFRVGTAEKFSTSGAVENEANVWIHPPRDLYFKILAMNPFPYIKTPPEVGNQWTWQLGISDYWKDKRWSTWKGTLETNYEYQITEQQTISTKLGTLDCYVVEAVATNSQGMTKLTSYFHPDYGFVKMRYTNIDGSKTNLELVSLSN